MLNRYSTLSIVLALLCLYLFATGATSFVWPWNEGLFLDKTLAPIRDFSLPSMLCVFGALLALLGFFFGLERGRQQGGQVDTRPAWRKGLEIAFVLNVVLAAGVVLALWLFATLSPSGSQIVGILFATALIEVTLGTVLAVVLFFKEKAKASYFSALTVHVAEVLVLGVVFVLGSTP